MTRSGFLKRVAAFMMVSAVGWPTTANAQDETTPGDVLTSSSVVWGLSSVAIITVAVAVSATSEEHREGFMSTSSSTLQTTTKGRVANLSESTRRRALAYIKSNKAAVGQDVMVGGGDALADIGSILGVLDSERVDFAAAARDARGEIRPLLTDEAAGLPELDVALAAIARAFVVRRAGG